MKSASCVMFEPTSSPLPRALLKFERSHILLVAEVASRKSNSPKLHDLDARRGVVKQCTYTNHR
eukprot:4676376-Alexandrium_andersonii.AAC.1